MTQEQQEKLAKLEETIRQAQQQIEELKNPKPKKFEWKHQRWHACLVDLTNVKYHFDGTGGNSLEYGRYRLTKETAEQSLARNKRANRLEALAEQLGGLKKFETDESNYFIYSSINGYGVSSNKLDFNPCTVYMTKETAIKICEMLNNGTFSLEGEL